MRALLRLLAAVFLLPGCASLRPAPDDGRNLTHVCYPGSAIKRQVPDAAAYPEWMIARRGSCLHH